MSLEGKKIFITGGSSGMGFATAQMAVEADGYVIIAARSTDRLGVAKVKIGRNVETYSLDVTREDEVKQLFEKIDQIDHIVSCAAGEATGPFLESDTAKVKEYFESKFWGQYYTAKYGAKKMVSGGSITLFGGAANRRATPNMTPSASINGAIEGLAGTLAVELAPIRVNVVSPGMIDTQLHDAMTPEAKKGLFDLVSQSLPAGRVGLPEDAAKAVMYLMQNDYATGSVIVVDGGYAA